MEQKSRKHANVLVEYICGGQVSLEPTPDIAQKAFSVATGPPFGCMVQFSRGKMIQMFGGFADLAYNS